MKRIVARHRVSWLIAAGVAGVVAFAIARVFADSPPSMPATAPSPSAKAGAAEDRSKDVNNGPRERIDAQPRKDPSKFLVEFPVERVLAAKSVATPAPSAEAFTNPKVEPGKVHWHKSFDDACAAARKSGKPVLLFQMMGKLDERFC